MTLDEYLRSGARTVEDVAERAGLTPASISRIRRGQQKPSFDAIRGLVQATDRAVSSDDLLGLSTRPVRPAKTRAEQTSCAG